MKKIYILVTSIFVLSSCAGILDVDSKIDPTYTNSFNTERDLESITNQIHSTLKSALNESAMYNVIGEKMDYTGRDIKNYRDFSRTTFTNTNINMNWESHYDLIYMCNVFIDNYDRAKVSQERKNHYLAQALFVKGLAYFDVARKWGDAVITKNSTTTTAYYKSPAKDVVEEAIRNATAAYAIIPKFEDLRSFSGNVLSSKQNGSKAAAAALLAHAYAWKASMIELYGWQTELTPTQCRDSVLKYSSQIISGQLGYYDLEDNAEALVQNSLRGTYKGAKAKEVIFEFDTDYDYVEFPTSFVPGYTSKMIGYPVRYQITEDMGRMFFDLLENFCDPLLKNSTVRTMYADGDKRRNAFFYDFEGMEQLSEDITGNCAYPYKWREEGTAPASWGGLMAKTLMANYVYWRLADIILLRAETYAMLNRSGEAIIDLNRVRLRAGANVYESSEGDLKMVIFREREKELFMEGHRFYDIVRNKLYTTELPSTAGRGYSALTIGDVKEGALYLPLHRFAFENNTTMTQNRYWVKFIQD